MENTHETTEQIARRDMIENDMENIQDVGLLKGGSLIYNPAQEARFEFIQKLRKELEQALEEKTKLIEHYKHRVEKRLFEIDAKSSPGKDKDGKKKIIPLTRDQLLKELKAFEDSEELDITKRKLKEAQDNAHTAISEKEKLEKQFNQYQKDQAEILTEYQADHEIQKKVRQLQELRLRVDNLNNSLAKKQHELKTYEYKVEKDRIFYNEEILPKYNAKVSEIHNLDLEIQHKRKELGKLAKIQPLKPGQDTPRRKTRLSAILMRFSRQR